MPPPATAVDEPQTPEPSGRVDPNGVPFNPQFCANAKDPFYSTGKRTGQWKKARGVADSEYDAWYAAQNPSSSVPSKSPVAESDAPATAGEFFTWVAERQKDGLLTAAHMQSAYAMEALTSDHVLSEDPSVAADAITRLYARLNA